jgi:hypothetical protein
VREKGASRWTPAMTVTLEKLDQQCASETTRGQEPPGGHAQAAEP